MEARPALWPICRGECLEVPGIDQTFSIPAQNGFRDFKLGHYPGQAVLDSPMRAVLVSFIRYKCEANASRFALTG